jgi:hypothetical protein
MRAERSLRISHAGLRGVVGAGGLTASHVLDFASAFVCWQPTGSRNNHVPEAFGRIELGK